MELILPSSIKPLGTWCINWPMRSILYKSIRILYNRSKNLLELITENEDEVQQELAVYLRVIEIHSGYFREMKSTEKQRFVYRCYRFNKNKTYQYTGMEPDAMIPILVSAAAVQITFGLRNYRMSYFRKIFISADAYTYGNSDIPWAGHVNRRGIYLSWKHFREGLAQENDRNNVGLHEMAHALVYSNFLDIANAETHFIEQFELYRIRFHLNESEGLERGGLFTPQAFKNYHECWAEGVELFFENPHELYEKYPEIYNCIKNILNQDSLNQVKISRTSLVK